MDFRKDLEITLQKRAALMRQLDAVTGVAKYLEEKIREHEEATLAEARPNEVAAEACRKAES